MYYSLVVYMLQHMHIFNIIQKIIVYKHFSQIYIYSPQIQIHAQENCRENVSYRIKILVASLGKEGNH